MPTIEIESFKKIFAEKIAKYQIGWEVVGFQAPDGKIYPFGTDTKVLSTVFETLSAPLIAEIAVEHGYTIETSGQTIYPDFTLTPPAGTPRIAIDIKTTYRDFNTRGKLGKFWYTLGSYTSFLRSPGARKNIRYPYREYGTHWVLGFLYTRRVGVASKVYYCPEELGQMHCPYTDVEYFIQEKYKISGETPASGNTTNIGSFHTADIEELRNGNGPFAKLDKEVCDEYWRHFEKDAAKRPYRNIGEFDKWRAAREKGAKD